LPDGWEEDDPINPASNQIIDPCKSADSLKKNKALDSLFRELEKKVSDKKEYAYNFSQNSDGAIKDLVLDTGNTGTGTTPINTVSRIDALLHSHYDGLLSIFTSDDLNTLATFFNQNGFNNPSSFIYGLITSSGTQYVLQISDTSAFSIYANRFRDNQYYLKVKEQLSLTYGLGYNVSNDDNEQYFMEYMKDLNIGMTLFKYNKNNTKWEPLTLDVNNKVIKQKCK
jgi:hypothetical protein